jgi:hypothetical protein
VIAERHTHGPAIAIGEGLDRDRAVDESGNQLSVFGRRGARPFNAEEQLRLFMLRDADGNRTRLYTVSDFPPDQPLAPKAKPGAKEPAGEPAAPRRGPVRRGRPSPGATAPDAGPAPAPDSAAPSTTETPTATEEKPATEEPAPRRRGPRRPSVPAPEQTDDANK